MNGPQNFIESLSKNLLACKTAISYTKDHDKKKIEEDFIFNFKYFIESLYYSEDIAELDVIENFDNEKEKPVVSKKDLTIEDFVSLCTGSRYITHNLIWAGTIGFRYFEQDSSPGVRVVVNTCNITLTFPVNGRYNSEPEQFLRNIIDDIYCSPCFGKCQFVKFDNTFESMT